MEGDHVAHYQLITSSNSSHGQPYPFWTHRLIRHRTLCRDASGLPKRRIRLRQTRKIAERLDSCARACQRTTSRKVQARRCHRSATLTSLKPFGVGVVRVGPLAWLPLRRPVCLSLLSDLLASLRPCSLSSVAQMSAEVERPVTTSRPPQGFVFPPAPPSAFSGTISSSEATAQIVSSSRNGTASGCHNEAGRTNPRGL